MHCPDTETPRWGGQAALAVSVQFLLQTLALPIPRSKDVVATQKKKKIRKKCQSQTNSLKCLLMFTQLGFPAVLPAPAAAPPQARALRERSRRSVCKQGCNGESAAAPAVRQARPNTYRLVQECPKSSGRLRLGSASPTSVRTLGWP